MSFTTEADSCADDMNVSSLNATLQTETAAFTYYDGNSAQQISKAHVGGVTFDILDRDRKLS